MGYKINKKEPECLCNILQGNLGKTIDAYTPMWYNIDTVKGNRDE